MACKSCKYFDEDETWGSKGHCDYLGIYVYPDESSSDCSHYEKRDKGGCYMTTACCEYYGLPDDCRELTAMRSLRDDYMRYQDGGHEMIENYYQSAPVILEKLDALADKNKWYEYIFQVVQNCSDYVEKKDFQKAMDTYQSMVTEFRDRFLS